MSRLWIPLAGLLGASGVAMAAYTSHGLGFIDPPAAREVARATLRTATNFQLLHALLLLTLGLWMRVTGGNRIGTLAAALCVLGTVLFSGLIYLQTLTSIQTLRPLVPWGGTSLILAWLAVAAAGLRPTDAR